MKIDSKPVPARVYRPAPWPVPLQTTQTDHAAPAPRSFGSPIAQSPERPRADREHSKVHFLTAQELLAPSPAADAVSVYVEESPAPGPNLGTVVVAGSLRAGTPADTQQAHGHSACTARRGLSRRLLGLACSYMEDNLGENFTLNDLGRAVGISRFHFSRLFRVSTGQSPMGYSLRLRIQRAKEMLLQGDRKICEIAMELGFFDQSHFSRTFRRMTGVSPGEYVRMCPVAEVAV
jgi:AraC family transcriptional regulator